MRNLTSKQALDFDDYLRIWDLSSQKQAKLCRKQFVQLKLLGAGVVPQLIFKLV